MTDPVLERFHRALIEEIQTQRPEYLTQPFTVAEVYQNLVPYGSHRDRIGVEMKGDYEHALLRLLAGEGGYLILESEPALEELRSELDAKSPNTAAYRDFAAVDVRLNQAYLDLSTEALDEVYRVRLPDLVEELEAEDQGMLTELAPAESNASASLGPGGGGGDIFSNDVADQDERDSGSERRVGETSEVGVASAFDEATPSESQGTGGEGEDRDASATRRISARPPLEPEYVETEEPTELEEGKRPAGGSSTSEARRGIDEGSCVWCRADLPDRDDVNYCPFCGTDLRLFPCISCGAEIEPGWMYCTACGAEVDA